ncbi:MAG: ABC transporter permease, partial [Desulfobacterales bacterium]|nr:ABC transporter permease [Desulfobacterales bacterium]
TIRRVGAYSVLDEVLRQSAEALARTRDPGAGPGVPLHDTLRPSKRKTWQSYLPDKPALGGEVAALAGFLGVSLATTGDARPAWGTPYDLPGRIDWAFAAGQSELVTGLIETMARAPVLRKGGRIREGFSTVTGRARFLRHGELFADMPAPGSVMLAYQGPGRYHAMVNSLGRFYLKGVADKKHVLDKVIIEGFRFDEETGAVKWAIDKKLTGKSAYRVKMRRRDMETDLVMFACKQTTIFELLEPRTFRPMTKIQLIDGRRETLPRRYWYSRIDTRVSTICSIYMEPDARLKLTLSDTVLRKKMILTNATDNRPDGVGYRLDRWPVIHRTAHRAARDMWALLGPRISNLENHGIKDDRIRAIQSHGLETLQRARDALEQKRYDRFNDAAAASWALASRVYDHVEKTRKDVLFGVLFYIALFVPFAFCMERLLFSFSTIHKRIIAFLGILLLLIVVIYQVHPAFQLAYSPSVVILAFFIMGLSLMVTLIIFFRFEEEMVLLQRRAARMRPVEISRWKAFVAAFFLGVSNLRRRRLRTALTCLTLIILTFTIMSFTAVKTTRHHARILYEPDASYQGLLLKNTDWRNLPAESLGTLANAFGEDAVVLPRVYLESEDKTKAVRLPVRFGDRVYEARGATGLSAREGGVTGLDAILVNGRWHREGERRAALLPRRMAERLGVDPGGPGKAEVLLWGMPFRVVGVFSGRKLMARTDLDGEPLTPVTFPREASTEMTEIEMEAMESGEDVRAFQSRYEHMHGDHTIILPHRTLLSAGGKLKAAAVRFPPGADTRAMARRLVDRFGLSLFSGEKDGVHLYHAGDAMSYSGAPNILIPLIISVFIVLNTMIGSVYERKSEIGIYTSVGLAPSHVAFLFVAEAMAFAVLSTVMGYILAQVSAGLFAGTALWAGLTVNYSSLTGVAAMVLVMLVVLVSVIYPSRVAARIAIPDVNRSWKMPDPKQNRLDLILPFLLKPEERDGVGGYLLSYLTGHQDVSHGLFSTGDVRCVRDAPGPSETGGGESADGSLPGRRLHLHARVWLAPFDFGIMQRVEFLFRPCDQQRGYMEIAVSLEREAGEANAWGRINRNFINDLRKQLLIWRSLDQTAARRYEEVL